MNAATVDATTHSNNLKTPNLVTPTQIGADQSCTPPTRAKDQFYASGTTHFYQTVMDCCDDGSTSSSSGYGRSSTTSNSSGNGASNCAMSGLASASQLDSGIPSPTPPMFRDTLFTKSNNGIANISPSMSVSTGVIGAPNLELSNNYCLDSPLSSHFLDSQLAAVTADLCDLTDLPKLIPPSESVQSDKSLYGSSFDMRLSNPTPPIGHRGLLDNSDTSVSSFFSDYSTNGGNQSGIIFDSNSAHSHNIHESSGGGSTTNSGFTISPMPPSNGSSNQCFTILMQENSNTNTNKPVNFLDDTALDKRTAVSVAAACLSDPFHSQTTTPTQSQNGYSSPSGNSNQTNSPTATSLCDRDLFYRLIIRYVHIALSLINDHILILIP